MKQALHSARFRMQAKKVLYITIAWTIFSVCKFLYEWTVLVSYEYPEAQLDVPVMFQASLIAGLLGGILGGAMLVSMTEYWLRNKPYGLALLYMLLTYTVVSLFVVYLTNSYFYSKRFGESFFSTEVQKAIFQYFATFDYLKNFITWLLVVLMTIIVLLINDKYGPGVFRDFLLGKYFRPKREERIFMFLDLRSSTAIAEKLGEERFFNLLKDIFEHVTPSIIYAKGQIYQYVGDEIIVSWKMNQGLENANCIRCFFDIQRVLSQKMPYYEERYSIKPEFKAGLHYGHVMAGELGVVKRDIAFSGDVLNTASRIQNKCNEMGVDILLSQFLLDKLALPPHTFEPRKIGDMLLKGKQQRMVLYTV